MLKPKLIKMNLHLFDEDVADTNINADDSQQQEEFNGDEGLEGGEEYQDEETDETNEDDDNTESQDSSTLTIEDRQAQYEAFKQANKDLFANDFQQAFNNRFKEHKNLESQYNALLPVAEGLKRLYGTDDINQAVEMFKQYQVEALAEEAGMSPEQYAQMMEYQTKAQQFDQYQQQQQQDFEMQQRVEGWYKEAEQLQTKYPQFNLQSAAENQAFVDLLEKGVSVEKAYEVTHIQEIIANAQQQAEKQVVNNIQSRKQRPLENGTLTQQSNTFKTDVSKMTYKDREEIRQRVARGEQITF